MTCEPFPPWVMTSIKEQACWKPSLRPLWSHFIERLYLKHPYYRDFPKETDPYISTCLSFSFYQNEISCISAFRLLMHNAYVWFPVCTAVSFLQVTAASLSFTSMLIGVLKIMPVSLPLVTSEDMNSSMKLSMKGNRLKNVDILDSKRCCFEENASSQLSWMLMNSFCKLQEQWEIRCGNSFFWVCDQVWHFPNARSLRYKARHRILCRDKNFSLDALEILCKSFVSV